MSDRLEAELPYSIDKVVTVMLLILSQGYCSPGSTSDLPGE